MKIDAKEWLYDSEDNQLNFDEFEVDRGILFVTELMNMEAKVEIGEKDIKKVDDEDGIVSWVDSLYITLPNNISTTISIFEWIIETFTVDFTIVKVSDNCFKLEWNL